MLGEVSKQNWVLLAITAPIVAGLTHLTWSNVRPPPPASSYTRDVSFKMVFDARVGFPQRIRQTTIERLLGPEYELVPSRYAAEQPVRPHSGEAGDSRDSQINYQGGLLTLRVPKWASSTDIAARLEQLSNVKSVTIYMK